MFDLWQLGGNFLLIAASIAVVAVGVTIIYRMRKDLFEGDQQTRAELLAPYQEAFEEGLIAREEYERICQAIDAGGTSLEEELQHGLSRARLKAELEAAKREQAAVLQDPPEKEPPPPLSMEN